MKFATVRKLKNQTSEMLRTAARGTDVLITSHGRPVAVLHGLSEDELEDYVLSHHPEIRQSIEDGWRHHKMHGGLSVEEVMKEIRKKRGMRPGKLRA